MIKYKMMLIFWSFKECRVSTEDRWAFAVLILARTLVRVWSLFCGYKEGLWKRSAGTNGNVVSLCDFLSSLFPPEIGPLVKRHLCFLLPLQDWMSWFKTHKCNFNFDCLLVYFMHLLLEEGEQDFKRTFWGQNWHLTWYIPQEHEKQKHLFI